MVKEIKESIRRGIEFLEAHQDADGSWSHDADITAICLMAISRDPHRHEREKSITVQRAGRYLAKFAEGTIESPITTDNQDRLATISLCLTALAMSGESDEKNIALRTVNFLTESGKQLWRDKGQSTLPTLYKRHLVLEALYIIENHNIRQINKGFDIRAIWESAKAYTESCQIIDKRFEMITDESVGRFILIPVDYLSNHRYQHLGKSRFKLEPCIVTFAGIKSLIYCGVSRNDVSIKLGLKWLQEQCPIRDLPELGSSGFFTYLYMVASTIRFLDNAPSQESGCSPGNIGIRIIEVTLSNQKGNGSWINTKGIWRENNSFLCSAYAILTLANIVHAISS